ncbi:Acetylcholinesterase [Dactylellina cionopaga]|nr:Acetylcholinesterase [Dactylellina cionopaga]
MSAKYKYDLDFEAHAGPILAAAKNAPPAPLHDVETIRNGARLAYIAWGKIAAASPTDTSVQLSPVTHKTYTCKSKDGYEIIIHHFQPETSPSAAPTPAILHIHGGGMIISHMELQLGLPKNYASTSQISTFSVDYRVAPEVTSTTPVEDVYAALQWLHSHAQELNVDPTRIAIMGESAGGGIAAGVALLARDRSLSPPIAKQILIYPMLDDRNTKPTPVAPFAVWSYDNNLTGWTALLGKDVIGTDEVSQYAAPARATDLSNLPATYIDVGGLDIFLTEDIEFAKRLAESGVEVEAHVYPGVPHAFEMLAPAAVAAKRARENRLRAMRSLL